MKGLRPDINGLRAMCQHNQRLSPRFRACLEPVMDYFDCSFIHMDGFIEGYVWGMHTHDAMFRHYLIEGDGFRNDPLFSPDLWWPSVFVWPTTDSGLFKDVLNQSMSERFQICSGISFCFQDHNRFYSIAMGCSTPGLDLVNMALKEQSLMKIIWQYILKKMKKDIALLEKRMFPVAKYAGERYFMPEKADNKSSEERIHLLLSMGAIKRSDLKLLQLQLTDKERQCAYLYLKGYALDHLSRLLDIPIGTGRRSIHEVKRKLGVTTKKDLLPALKKLDLLEYFNH